MTTIEPPTGENAADENKITSQEPSKRRYFRVPISKHLPRKLRLIRRFSGLTQGQILLRINPLQDTEDNRARISQYESGQRVPSLIEVLNYAKIYGISMDYLVDDNLEFPSEPPPSGKVELNEDADAANFSEPSENPETPEK